MKPLSAFVTVALAAAASTSALAEPCFRTRDLGNHTIIDDHTLYAKVGVKDVWRIGVKGGCFAGVHATDPLIIRTTASIGMVCKPLDLDLSVQRGGAGGIPSACIVDSISQLTPKEIAAIPKGKKP